MTGPLLGFILRAAMWVIIPLLLLDNLGFNVTTLVASPASAASQIRGWRCRTFSATFSPRSASPSTLRHRRLRRRRRAFWQRRACRSEDHPHPQPSRRADHLPTPICWKSRIRNYKRMQERRIAFAFRITYETPLDPGGSPAKGWCVTSSMHSRRSVSTAPTSRALALPRSTSGWSITFSTMTTASTWISSKPSIWQLHDVCRRGNIDFAYPTQTLHLVGAMPASGCVQPPASGDRDSARGTPAIASAP